MGTGSLSPNTLLLGFEAFSTVPQRLGFQVEGAGKLRIFAIPNAVKQSILRPAHNRCMKVLRLIPMDGTGRSTRLPR